MPMKVTSQSRGFFYKIFIKNYLKLSDEESEINFKK